MITSDLDSSDWKVRLNYYNVNGFNEGAFDDPQKEVRLAAYKALGNIPAIQRRSYGIRFEAEVYFYRNK